MRKLAPALIATTLVAGGCGGGHRPATATAPAPSATTNASAPTTSQDASTPPAPKHKARKPQRDRLKATVTYKCNGKPLRGLSSSGPVKVKPSFVKAGDSFQVIVTDPTAQVAQASLTGVSTDPITAGAKRGTGGLAATLRVPPGASCGNKLVTVEGDVSAQAYVGVAR